MSLCPPHLKRSLLHELRVLPFSACLSTIALLLARMGYEDVRYTSRRNRRGRHADGGCDLTAIRSLYGGERRYIVQFKGYALNRPVYSSALNELCGVVIHEKASEGILITSGSFSASVPRPAYASGPVAPLRLIDGDQLADLMTLYGVGVERTPPLGPKTPTRYHLDSAFFHRLEQQHR